MLELTYIAEHQDKANYPRLIYHEDSTVRSVVARHGIGLDILVYDPARGGTCSSSNRDMD